jgi:hypothetical protein
MSSVGAQQPLAVDGVQPTTSTSPPPYAFLQGTLDGVAGMLSMSPTDLKSSLKQGESISDLAAQSGVSRSSIVQYVEQTVQQNRAAAGSAPIDQQTLDSAVNRAIDRHRGHHHRTHGAAPAATQTPADPSAASTSTSSSLVDLLG